ncbi:hypothetical protein RPALISO_167 [Ruegeria phage RpAliso]|nr:hypothetical protein RPALISO_167 [Ruegeria phage RpAliso]
MKPAYLNSPPFGFPMARSGMTYEYSGPAHAYAGDGEVVKEDENYAISGFHRQSGVWVQLLTVDSEGAAKDALHALHGQQQPNPAKVVVKAEDFSAFKSTKVVEFRHVVR